ncbi:hypothetical protein DL96DRAFT_431245 [Flagelloscypha sp. PMI_526]|nr:hypothetical protein DL96DRAFT_431245 [Flagelloscypha sp. PMI_526]
MAMPHVSPPLDTLLQFPSPAASSEAAPEKDNEEENQTEDEQEQEVNMRLDSPQDMFNQLRKSIELRRIQLHSKLKDPKVTKTIEESFYELKALELYNARRLELAEKRQKLLGNAKDTSRKAFAMKIRKKAQSIKPSAFASASVAESLGKGSWLARRIIHVSHCLLNRGYYPEKEQGKGACHPSYFNDVEVRAGLENWSKGLVEITDGGWEKSVKPEKLRKYVNNHLFEKLGIESEISLSTASRWLKALGFQMKRKQKGVYFDGHERDDVVASRKEFETYMHTQVLPFCYEYNGPDLIETAPTLKDGEKIHYPIFHDECSVHANDLDPYVWEREGEEAIRGKSRGRIVHVSDFIIEHCGRLALSTEEIEIQMNLPEHPLTLLAANLTTASSRRKKTVAAPVATARNHQQATAAIVGNSLDKYRLSTFDARRIIHPGSGHDPWWDMPQLLAQTKDALDIFETKYPDGVGVFIFDCSSAHEAFADDALIAHKMNRSPGGAQPKMHDTVNPVTGAKQCMVFEANCTQTDSDGKSLAGQAKGMEQVLRERGLYKDGDKINGVCADCKKSEAAREKARKVARAHQEADGDIHGVTRGIEDENFDVERSTICSPFAASHRKPRSQMPLPSKISL